MYPHMRLVQLDRMAPITREMQQLCSCCTGLESLLFVQTQSCAPAICMPLLQLSALTSLHVSVMGPAAAAEAAAGLFAVAGRLTGLKSLTLDRIRTESGPVIGLSTVALLQLTALTALESLTVDITSPGIQLGNKICLGWAVCLAR